MSLRVVPVSRDEAKAFTAVRNPDSAGGRPLKREERAA